MAKNTHISGVPAGPDDVVDFVDSILKQALAGGASDIHLEPTASEMIIKFRLDGVLDKIASVPAALSENVITRLKVLGGLLTYRNDVPQEGRLEIKDAENSVLDRR